MYNCLRLTNWLTQNNIVPREEIKNENDKR